MTTAAAGQTKRTRESSDSKRHLRGARTDNDDSYLVLIRLPTIKPAAPKITPVGRLAADQDVSDSSGPAVLAFPGSQPSPEVANVPSPLAEERASQPQSTTPAPAASAAPFLGVRLLGQLAVAVLTIGLFVAAYLVIAGGRDGAAPPRNDEAAKAAPNSQSSDAAAAFPPSIERDRPQVNLTETPPADEPASPASDTTPATDKAPQEPPVDAAPPRPNAAKPATTDEANEPPKPAQSLLDEPARSAPERPGAADRPVAPEPRKAPTPGSAEPADAAPPYPMTDPRTYQYPANYHEMLRARAVEAPPADGTSGPVGRSANVWQPSTARPQPRLEAPPLR